MKNRMYMIAITMMICAGLVLPAGLRAEAAALYQDGEYSVPFQVLKHDSDEISATNDFLVSPANVVIKQGVIHAILTLNNGSWWQEFKVRSADSDTYADVEIVSENADNNTRIVKFPIADPGQDVYAKIHIVVTGIPGFDYDNRYDIRFKFDHSGIPVAEQPSEPVLEQDPSDVETLPDEPDRSAPEPAPASEPEQDRTPGLSVDSPSTPSGPASDSDDAVIHEDVAEPEPEAEEMPEPDEEEGEQEHNQAVSDESADSEEENDDEKKLNAVFILLPILTILALGIGLFAVKKRNKS